MHSGILNVTVSCFKNYWKPEHPKNINLLTWLTSNKYEDKVRAIRAISDKNERDIVKATLPAITPSGIFSKRNEAGLIKHSGLIQFDIDLKDNPHISNYDELKEQISNIENIAYCALSVSGTGYWGLIPIQEPKKHHLYFDSIQERFELLGLVIDPKPRNVSSLRTYTYDPDAYFNHNAKVLSAYKTERKPPILKNSIWIGKSLTSSATQEKVEAFISRIIAGKIDMTSSYHSWFSIGCSLANEFGENGRHYFHALSQYHPGYSPNKTDYQYTRCLKNTYKFHIGTLFYYFRINGID